MNPTLQEQTQICFRNKHKSAQPTCHSRLHQRGFASNWLLPRTHGGDFCIGSAFSLISSCYINSYPLDMALWSYPSSTPRLRAPPPMTALQTASAVGLSKIFSKLKQQRKSEHLFVSYPFVVAQKERWWRSSVLSLKCSVHRQSISRDGGLGNIFNDVERHTSTVG